MPICSTDAVILGRKCLNCRCIGNICLAVLKTEYDDEPLSAAQRFFFFSDSIQKVIKSGYLRQHRTIPALRLKHRSGSCGTASAAPRSPYRHLELCGIALNLFLPVLSLRNEPTRISCELPHSPAQRFCIFHRSSPSPSTLKPPSVTVKPTSCPTSSAVQRGPT